jgi:glutamyl-tRNA(Gln) amidotransferase subunit E
MTTLDYIKLGLKAGLEVHQQLDTGKLFIRTPSELSDEINFTIERKLRPVASELGEYDKAALDAFKRNETFYYQGNTKNISLVETDEEPPQPLDKEAFRTVLEVALLCKSLPVSQAIVMRKTIIDGSNTSAFQRTMLVSLGGELDIGEKKIGIETIAIEEDAARPIKKEKGKVYYNLDRLGIPLIELATAPDIKTPKEAIATAKKIGEIMRLTCKTKRGKGTIRQDVNVSIKKGARCEIKGCQDLELIGTVVEKEAERQIDLINLKEKLNNEIGKTNLFEDPKEVTKAFDNTGCKFIKGKTVYGMKLTHMKGYLGEKVGAKRFGSELSAYGKSRGVSGIIHLDELPNYGISNIEVDKVKRILGCGEEDNFIITVSNKENAFDAFKTIKERIKIAFEKIPSETRGALEDGSSEYQRPIASGARMYPETDLLNEEISTKLLEKITKALPKSVNQREAHYKKIGLNTNHVEEMKLNNFARFFESVVNKGANAVTTATLLLQTLTELRRDNIKLKEIDLIELEQLILLESEGKINKNNLKQAVVDLSKGKTISKIIESQTSVDDSLIASEVAKVVKSNEKLIKEKGMGSIGPLMGDLMKIKALRGADGKVLSELLRKEINKAK